MPHCLHKFWTLENAEIPCPNSQRRKGYKQGKKGVKYKWKMMKAIRIFWTLLAPAKFAPLSNQKDIVISVLFKNILYFLINQIIRYHIIDFQIFHCRVDIKLTSRAGMQTVLCFLLTLRKSNHFLLLHGRVREYQLKQTKRPLEKL